MLRQIVEKKFPRRDAPKSGHFVIVKANHESGYHIESPAEIRERPKCVDLLDDTMDTEQTCDFPKHWQPIHIESNSGMSKELRDVQKVSCATAQIENLLGSRQIEFKLANPANVDCDPSVEIEILWPVRAGISHGVSLPNLLEASWINCLDNALCLQLEAFWS
jgi:hypothetical protein